MLRMKKYRSKIRNCKLQIANDRRQTAYCSLRWFLAVLLLLYLAAGPALAQSPLSVRVDRAEITADETVMLIVEVDLSSKAQPSLTLPVFESFAIVGQNQASQTSIINGVVSTKVVYQFRLQPRTSGTLTIPPITVTVQGQSYDSDPITVEVAESAKPTPPPAQSPADENTPTELSGQDFFVEALVSNPEPYTGEQLLYLFRFYQAVQVRGQLRYDAPELTGFWRQGEPEQTQRIVDAAGRTYQLTELSTIIFPTVTGDTEIEPAALYIGNGALPTGPVQVAVQPLPANAPDDFTGAVGQFTISAEVDRLESLVNEPLNLRVTLTGQGNINNIPDPTWPEPDNWRIFESTASVNSEITKGVVGGTRYYELLLIPGKAGEYTWPALTYSYFDPELGEYQTAMTDPIPVTILPGEAQAPIPVVVGGDKADVTRLASDIRYIKPLSGEVTTAPRRLIFQPLYWLAWLTPLVMLIGVVAWQKRQDYLRDNVGLVRRSQAKKQAQQALKEARQTQDNPYEAAETILNTYLSDKLDQPVSGLTQKALTSLLQHHKISATIIEQVISCLEESHMGRYAFGGQASAESNALLDRIEATIEQLEKENL